MVTNDFYKFTFWTKDNGPHELFSEVFYLAVELEDGVEATGRPPDAAA